MKLTFMRTTVLLALALGLSACGGKAKFDLGGPVTGLVYEGLIITNIDNGDATTVHVPTPVGAATTFKLGQSLDYGQVYNVQITSTPAHQTCSLFSGADTAGRLSAISIAVTCSVQTFTIGGTVSGLRDVADTTPTGLVITNGADKLAVEINGAYIMPTKVPFAMAYGVTIVTQPTGKVCTIANPSGFVKTVQLSVGVTDPVNNIDISCVAAP